MVHVAPYFVPAGGQCGYQPAGVPSLAASWGIPPRPAAWLYGPSPAGSPSGNFVRYWWTDWMTDEPSPTAAATRFIDPARMSPAANIPSTALS